MTYHNARKYMAKAPVSYDGDNGLERVRYALKLLGLPQRKLRYIRLAGSNGKTVCREMLTSVLSVAEHTVGAVAMSELDEPREAITVGGEPLSIEAFCEAVARVATVAKTMRLQVEEAIEKGTHEADNRQDGEPPAVLLEGRAATDLTRGEILLCTALLAFERAGCELCLIESGEDGSDASLLLPPPEGIVICGVIPKDDREALAHMRRYIVRGVGEIVSAPQDSEAYRMLSDACASVNCRLSVPLRSSMRITKLSMRQTEFVYRDVTYTLGLCGRFQVVNAMTVLTALTMLRRLGYAISPEAEQEGLRRARACGRVEIISVSPLIVVDCTHRREAMQEVYDSMAGVKGMTGMPMILCMNHAPELMNAHCQALKSAGFAVQELYTVEAENSGRGGQAGDVPITYFRDVKSLTRELFSANREHAVLITGHASFALAVRKAILNTLAY